MLKIFLITPLVELPRPMPLRLPDGTITYLEGYCRTIGVAAMDLDQAVSMAKADIAEQELSTLRGEILQVRGGEAQPSSLEPEIKKHYQPPERPGIWYRSGRIFYRQELQPP